MKNDYLLIQEIEQKETTTASGIIIPVEKHNRKAKVINAGNAIHINQILAVIEDNG